MEDHKLLSLGLNLPASSLFATIIRSRGLALRAAAAALLPLKHSGDVASAKPSLLLCIAP